MTIYKEHLTIITKGGLAIFCRYNGYEIRSLESDGGRTCSDIHRNNYGESYWKKKALESLNLTKDDILMEIKGGKIIFRD